MKHWIIPLIMSKMLMLFLLLCITCFSTGFIAAAAPDGQQQGSVSGTVRDAASGEALIGVSVVVKGTVSGTLTDINGKFTIPVSAPQATLLFSFIGYTTQEISAIAGTPVNISMALEMTQISEVVVVGYGVQKKESVVGAITQVNSAALVKSGISNVTNAISGKLSGVLTMQQTGEPGNSSQKLSFAGFQAGTVLSLWCLSMVSREISRSRSQRNCHNFSIERCQRHCSFRCQRC